MEISELGRCVNGSTAMKYSGKEFFEAHKLFQVVHGQGDSGSFRSFCALNPAIQEGFVRLHRQFKRKLKKTKAPIYGPRSHDC